jgi:hypothetical protein
MYDYEDMPASTKTYTTDDPDWGIKAARDQLNWALSLPSDPEFKKLCTFVENTQSSEGIINQIRKGFKNADDLAKIAMAIEAMREELIEESACRFERATHA